MDEFLKKRIKESVKKYDTIDKISADLGENEKVVERWLDELFNNNEISKVHYKYIDESGFYYQLIR